MCVHAAYSSHGYYSRAVFISLRALTVQLLFEDSDYSKKYSNHNCMHLVGYKLSYIVF